MDDQSNRVAWLSWGRDAFARAHADQRPILLVVGAAWCRWCADMLRTTYRDPVVAQLIDSGFVPIWVDADRRPDINERYNLGGWPTTVFLTPAGQILGGETYVGPQRMATLLRQVAAAFLAGHHETASHGSKDAEGSAASPDGAADLDVGLETWLSDHVLDEFDAEHGGFGTRSKRIHTAALQFALRKCKEGDARLREVATRTLDAMGWGGLYDDADGGVFRYCEGRDWTAPSVEKLLTVNANALRLFLEGWSVLGEARYRDRAKDLLRYVTAALMDHADGGFFASQYADEHYYASDPSVRLALGVPRVDRSVYADATAQMVTAFVPAAEVFEDPSLLDFAVTSLERVVVDTYERGDGIAHHVDDDGAVRGLLVDHVLVGDALLDLYQATDREAYLDMAHELMLFVVRALADTAAGGFVDRVIAADDVGLLAEPIKPFGINCEAARVLARLSRLTDDDTHRQRAVATLASQTASARSHGVDAAFYVLALREVQAC